MTNKSKKKVIFIGGSSYSGSTMLDMMLANQQRGFSVGEIFALFRPFRPHHFDPECGCGDSRCCFWNRVKAQGEDRVYTTVFEMLPEVSVIVDSSKNPWWISHQTRNLSTTDIEVSNVLIWKSPVEFYHSMAKRGRKKWYRSWRNYYKLYFSLVDNFIAVEYKELAKNPSEQLRRIGEYCETGWVENQEKFWQKNHHTLFGNESAKIHLSSSVKKYSGSNPLNTESIKEKHRSIYYDENVHKNIPPEIRNYIEKSVELRTIHHALMMPNEKINVQKNRLSQFDLLRSKISTHSKQVIGVSLGRLVKVF